MNETEKTEKRVYRSPLVLTFGVEVSGPVMLACTGRVNCDELLGLGYECCADTEDACGGC
jgi:hypothetical protein